MQPHQPTGNIIEFDTSRMSSLEQVPSPFHVPRPASVAELHRQLGQQLQTSLEADRLLGIFLTAVRALVPVSGLSYRHGPTDLRLELGEAAPHRTRYHLNHLGESIGELVFQRSTRFDDFELHQLEALLPCLLFPLRNALLYRAALLDALRDPLTGAGNRVAMQQTLTREVELARRHGQPLSVLMLDMDHFKSINDRFGHPCGDEVLKAVTTRLKSQLRNVDMVFRYGGEEFLVLLSNTPEKSAALVGQRLCQAVNSMEFCSHDGHLPLTVSMGCASYRVPETLDALLARADSALYQAKRNGRNQMRLAV
ncbi:GGDEF domain-containing protein [Stutzerimonas tarimensis]|uniref:diguanylate cyclase n=1 Tax=Stutzerimonas tarimensis TaxID=1507735 RepID=A0ABV7T8S7_9GAMM